MCLKYLGSTHFPIYYLNAGAGVVTGWTKKFLAPSSSSKSFFPDFENGEKLLAITPKVRSKEAKEMTQIYAHNELQILF